jgi:hypothetical protein
MEVGVAGGRYSELFLIVNSQLPSWDWYMVEPFPNKELLARYHPRPTETPASSVTFANLSWVSRGIGKNANLHLKKKRSTESSFISSIYTLQVDFLYLDGAHDYETVKKELHLLWRNVRPGGVLAGHDYCNYGEPSLACRGCDSIPRCEMYTALKNPGNRARNQHAVVKSVQE